MATQERSAVDWLAGLDTTILKAWNEQAAAEDAADATAEVARRGHCLQCRGWCAPDADGFCFSCAVHPVEALAVLWQVVGMHRRTKALRVMADGLSREDAEETRRKAMDDELTAGWAIFLVKQGDSDWF
jgi:hypothetical protein